MAEADADGHFTGSSYPSGSYGYDISNYQCGNLPPSPHTIGLVEVVGESYGSTNACLASEAAWAGGGLNLYIYLTYGQAPTSGDPACPTTASPSACNYGFGAAIDAFDKAEAAGVNTSVAWWLDVEPDTPGVPTGHPTPEPTPRWSRSHRRAPLRGPQRGRHLRQPRRLDGHRRQTTPPAVPYWAADWDIRPGDHLRERPFASTPDLPWARSRSCSTARPSFPYPAGGMSTAFDNDYAC